VKLNIMKILNSCLSLVVMMCFAPSLLLGDDVAGLVAKAAALEQKVADLDQKLKELSAKETELSTKILEFTSKGEVRVANSPSVKVESLPNDIRVRNWSADVQVHVNSRITIEGQQLVVTKLLSDGWLEATDRGGTRPFWVNLNATSLIDLTPF
jgi:hypothetical protein